MFKTILLASLIVAAPVIANATEPTGTISEVTFYGSGANEVMFVTISPKSSACPYAGAYVMPSKERPGMTAALLAAFQAQNTITIYGTGQCNASWTNYEVLSHASIKK